MTDTKTETTPAAEDIIRLVDANELEAKSIRELFNLVFHGYKTIDIRVRKDGKETSFQADWIARLARLEKKDA